MKVVGTIESLWRYPVKSMAGERLTEAYMGFPGFYGDRCYAFKNSAARKGFPYLNASAQQQMLRYPPEVPISDKGSQAAKFARSDEHRAGRQPGGR